MKLCRHWQTAPHGCGLSAASGCTFCKGDPVWSPPEKPMSEHDIAAKCAKQVSDMQTENERLRSGLRAVSIIVAGLSMTDANFGRAELARAELARLENYIASVLEGAA